MSLDTKEALAIESKELGVQTPQVERPDIGSSIFMALTPNFRAVVVGFSKEDQFFKLPCGKVEYRDIPGPESAEFKNLAATVYGWETLSHADLVKMVASGNRLDYRVAAIDNEGSPEYAAFLTAIARTCALRELRSETGIREDELLYVGPLAYVRPIRKPGKFIRQFHFFGILKKQGQLSRDCEEALEMGDPEYWDPVDILRWDVPKERKINPFHRIAFARCLIELRDQIGQGTSDPIPDFTALLARVEEAGFVLDEYETTIRGLMKVRDPRA